MTGWFKKPREYITIEYRQSAPLTLSCGAVVSAPAHDTVIDFDGLEYTYHRGLIYKRDYISFSCEGVTFTVDSEGGRKLYDHYEDRIIAVRDELEQIELDEIKTQKQTRDLALSALLGKEP